MIYFVTFTCILFLLENPVSKQGRPRSDATLCGISSRSALFPYDPFMGYLLKMGYTRFS